MAREAIGEERASSECDRVIPPVKASEGTGEGKRPLDGVGHAVHYLLLRCRRYEIIVDGRRQEKMGELW